MYTWSPLGVPPSNLGKRLLKDKSGITISKKGEDTKTENRHLKHPLNILGHWKQKICKPLPDCKKLKIYFRIG